MKSRQLRTLARLLQRKRGVTAMEIATQVGTVCPHKRLSELRDLGWDITRHPIEGQSYGRYTGRKVCG